MITTSFQKLVTHQIAVERITSIEISEISMARPSGEEVVLTDKNEIKAMMSKLSALGHQR